MYHKLILLPEVLLLIVCLVLISDIFKCDIFKKLTIKFVIPFYFYMYFMMFSPRKLLDYTEISNMWLFVVKFILIILGLLIFVQGFDFDNNCKFLYTKIFCWKSFKSKLIKIKNISIKNMFNEFRYRIKALKVKLKYIFM
jgi:hypothetical protein